MKKNRKITFAVLMLPIFIMMFAIQIIGEEIEVENLNYVEDETEIDEAGTYFMHLAIEDEFGDLVSDVVRLHVKYPNTVINYAVNEGIDAHDIVLLSGSLSSLSDAELIERAGARAWNLENGQTINDLLVNVEDSGMFDNGLRTVTFKTKNDTNLKVNIIEKDEIYINLEEVYVEGKPLLEDTIRTLSEFVLTLAIIPIVIFLVIFKYMEKKSKDTKELLESSVKR